MSVGGALIAAIGGVLLWHIGQRQSNELQRALAVESQSLTQSVMREVVELRQQVDSIPVVVDAEASAESQQRVQRLDALTRLLELEGMTLTAVDYYNRGNMYVGDEDYPAAVQAYDRALEMRPDYYQVMTSRAAALAGSGKFAEAKASANSALRVRPDYSYALVNRGIALGHLGKNEEAEPDIRRAIELDPKLAEA